MARAVTKAAKKPVTKAAKKVEKEARVDRVFAALADPTRREIIALLREAEELRVGDIAKVFDMSLNGVSKHLKVLERAGLITRRVEGTTHWLSAHWKGLQPAYEYLHHHQHFWSERVDALVDYVTKEKREKAKR